MISCPILLGCSLLPPLVCSFCQLLSASCLSPSFSSLCVCSFFLPLSFPLSCSLFDLGIPFLSEQTKQRQTSLNCNPQCTHTHTHTLSLSPLLITHRKWAPMQTRPAWPVEPRMEFQALKRSPVEEIEHDLSLPPSFILPCLCSTRHGSSAPFSFDTLFFTLHLNASIFAGERCHSFAPWKD